MSRETDPDPEGPNSSTAEWPRRTLMKIAGAGAGIAALGGASMTGAGQEEEDGPENDEDETETGGHFAEDLIDPTFGYPLAAGETDDLDLDHVVELYTEEGEGAHADFPAAPETGEEIPAEFAFDPVGIQIEPDDLVHFRITAGQHTVTAFHEKFSTQFGPTPTRVPDGSPAFTSPPLLDGESWLYQFPAEGVYDIQCLPHMPVGMVMRVVVFDPEEDDVDDEAFAAPTADDLPPNAQQVLDADELDPANIVDAGTVAWADLTFEAAQPETEQPAAPTVQVREHDEHGDILVTPNEMTLYMFDNDTQGEGSSACYDDCAEAWPPLTVEGDPVAGDGVEAELTTFEREHGQTQVAANGWPLYCFFQDEAPGDANGQGAGDVWWVLQPDGTPIRSGSAD